MVKSAMRGVPLTLLSGVTTGTGSGFGVPSSFSQHSFTIKAVGTVSAGKVKIESSDSASYSGTWELVGAEVTLVTDTELVVTFTGIIPFIRARVSTDVTGGGVVSVIYTGS